MPRSISEQICAFLFCTTVWRLRGPCRRQKISLIVLATTKSWHYHRGILVTFIFLNPEFTFCPCAFTQIRFLNPLSKSPNVTIISKYSNFYTSNHTTVKDFLCNNENYNDLYIKRDMIPRFKINMAKHLTMSDKSFKVGRNLF